MNPSCGAILTKKRRGEITERKEGESKKASEKIVRLKNNGGYLLFALPAVVFIVIFCYVPMYGILIAFKDADWYPGNSILSNEIAWVGLDNFKTFFSDPVCIKLIRNTFLLCIFGFIVGFPLPIAIALLLNSLKSKRMSKALSTLFNAPHFISLVVIVGMLYSFFGESGLVNNIREAMGLERYGYFREPEAFRPMFILSSNWQDFGWGTIIYLAALSGVNPEMHEAAVIDGASRWKRVRYIDFPAILPTVTISLIMSVGGLMNVGYEKAWMMQTPTNKETSDIISTWVYDRGLLNDNYALATAVGLFNSIVSVVLLCSANFLSKRISGDSMF